MYNGECKKAVFKTTKSDFFSKWLILTQPLHKLPKADQTVLAEILKLRYEYSFKINDEDLLNEFIFSTKNRATIMDSLKLSTDRFNNILSSLRKLGVITNNKINNAFIPKINGSTDKYSIVFEFTFE